MMRFEIKNIILMTVLLFTFTACQSQEREMSFQSIAQREVINYREENPALVVITNYDEIENLVPSLLAEDPDLADQLRRLDYDQTFALLVLQGQKRISGYSITVQRIVHQNDQITVEAEFVEPALGSRIHPSFTSPYHLVAVSKEGRWGKQVKFVLMGNNQLIAETTHFIP